MIVFVLLVLATLTMLSNVFVERVIPVTIARSDSATNDRAREGLVRMGGMRSLCGNQAVFWNYPRRVYFNLEELGKHSERSRHLSVGSN